MPSGVLIFKGMTVGILPGDFTISLNETGEQESKLILSTAYNVIPVWLKAAHDHLRQSKIASESISENWSEDSEQQKAMLISELTPSIQVFVSCGIALDALYDTLRPFAKIRAEEIQAWKDNGTSRGRQIVEVVRRVFNLYGETLKTVMVNKNRTHV